MKKIVCILGLLILTTPSFAQKLPFVIGGVAETAYGTLDDGSNGAGLNRMTPFIGAWISGIGYCRIGYGFYNYFRTDSEGDKLSVRGRTLNGTLGISLGGPNRPYIIGSFSRAKKLSNIGDVTWNEWGIGGGTTFQLLPTSAIVAELEYRWIRPHYDPVESERIKGTRLQFNLGFVIYVY